MVNYGQLIVKWYPGDQDTISLQQPKYVTDTSKLPEGPDKRSQVKVRKKMQENIPHNHHRFGGELWAADSEVVSWRPRHHFTSATQVYH